MGWKILNASLSVGDKAIPRDGGFTTATVTVTGETDDKAESNSFVASIRDDYVIPDILWESEPQTAGPNEEVRRSFSVPISCNRRGHVIGPQGSSGERTAELYAYVIGGGREGASDEVPVTCIR